MSPRNDLYRLNVLENVAKYYFFRDNYGNFLKHALMQNIGSFVQSIIFFFLIRTRSLRSGFSSTMFRDYSACYCFSTESNMRTASVECNDVCGFDMTFWSTYSYRFHLSIGAFNPVIYEISNVRPLINLIYMRFIQTKK